MSNARRGRQVDINVLRKFVRRLSFQKYATDENEVAAEGYEENKKFYEGSVGVKINYPVWTFAPNGSELVLPDPIIPPNSREFFRPDPDIPECVFFKYARRMDTYLGYSPSQGPFSLPAYLAHVWQRQWNLELSLVTFQPRGTTEVTYKVVAEVLELDYENLDHRDLDGEARTLLRESWVWNFTEEEFLRVTDISAGFIPSAESPVIALQHLRRLVDRREHKHYATVMKKLKVENSLPTAQFEDERHVLQAESILKVEKESLQFAEKRFLDSILLPLPQDDHNAAAATISQSTPQHAVDEDPDAIALVSRDHVTSSNSICRICQKAFGAGGFNRCMNPRILTCGCSAVFGLECVLEWIMDEGTCPNCMRIVA